MTLLVIRGNAADPHAVEVTREVPSGARVSGRAMGGDVGYVRVPAFGPGVPRGRSPRGRRSWRRPAPRGW